MITAAAIQFGFPTAIYKITNMDTKKCKFMYFCFSHVTSIIFCLCVCVCVCVCVCAGINPLNAELNPICCLLALLGVHHFLHVSKIRVK